MIGVSWGNQVRREMVPDGRHGGNGYEVWQVVRVLLCPGGGSGLAGRGILDGAAFRQQRGKLFDDVRL